jgi:nucleoside-diphosphate-sugar epimerase
MRVAVTGGSGQLGTHVVRRLLARADVDEVVSIDVRPPRIPGDKLRFVESDVRAADLARHLRGCDALVHLAFVVTKKLPRATFDDINVRGSENVFRSAYAAGIRRCVYTSSVAAYGVVEGHPRPLTESGPRIRQPEFAYACAKYDVEAFLDRFESEHRDLVVARIRPGVLIGTRIEHPGSSAARMRIVTDMGGGPAPIVWDEDVADAVVLALTRTARGAFNTVADEPLPAAEIARAAGLRYLPLPDAVLRGTAEVSALAERLGFGDAIDPAWLTVKTDMLVSSEKAKRELGWRPTCPTSIAVMKRFDREAPYRLDPRIALFVRMADATSRSAKPHPMLEGIRASYHLELTGRDGGDFTVTIAGGRVRLQSGVPRPPDATMTLDARSFARALAGSTDIATLAASGLLRTDGMGPASLVLDRLVREFRHATEAPGARGWVSRRLSDWFARG